jgi:hypothetical protein
MAAIATQLNVRRLLRELVERKLDEVTGKMTAIETKLDAIDQKLRGVMLALRALGRKRA